MTSSLDDRKMSGYVFSTSPFYLFLHLPIHDDWSKFRHGGSIMNVMFNYLLFIFYKVYFHVVQDSNSNVQ